MKKVLFVTTISGFLPQFEKNDVKLLREKQYEIHYASNFRNPIYTFDEAQLKEQGILLHQTDVEKSPARLAENMRAVRQLIRVIDEEGIDLVHCHNPMGGVAARLAAVLSQKKPYVVYTAHGFHFYKGAPLLNWLLYYPAERFLAHFTDTVVTINREDYGRAGTFRLRKGGQVFQIHSVGVDSRRFSPDPEIRDAKRETLKVPQGAFHIVTAAELNTNKNQAVVIEAVSRLPGDDIYYSICGKGPDEENLKRLIREKGLEGRVRLLGFRTDMEEILQTADCFAFPSFREGLGVAAVEALLCGVPLIAADNRGTREYAKDGENAIVCGADDAGAFADAIRRLREDGDLRRRLAGNSRASAGAFTTEEVEKTMRRVYDAADAEIIRRRRACAQAGQGGTHKKPCGERKKRK